MDKVTEECPQTTTFLKRKESRSGSLSGRLVWNLKRISVLQGVQIFILFYTATARNKLSWLCGQAPELWLDPQFQQVKVGLESATDSRRFAVQNTW